MNNSKLDCAFYNIKTKYCTILYSKCCLGCKFYTHKDNYDKVKVESDIKAYEKKKKLEMENK